MNVNSLVYGTISIITTVIVLSALGSMYSLLNKTAAEITQNTMAEIQPLVNTFCTDDYDCKQYQKDCNKCVNVLVGGVSLMDKCIGNKITCSCINKKCTNINNVDTQN